jgi:hypothetical protein
LTEPWTAKSLAANPLILGKILALPSERSQFGGAVRILETQAVLQSLGTIEDVAEAILELDLKFD